MVTITDLRISVTMFARYITRQFSKLTSRLGIFLFLSAQLPPVNSSLRIRLRFYTIDSTVSKISKSKRNTLDARRHFFGQTTCQDGTAYYHSLSFS